MEEKVFNVLKDGRPHFTRELTDTGALEYRRRLSDLRERGYVIQSVKIWDPVIRKNRPGYVMIQQPKRDLFAA